MEGEVVGGEADADVCGRVKGMREKRERGWRMRVVGGLSGRELLCVKGMFFSFERK